MAWKSAAESAATIRAAFKAKGWGQKHVSVRCENYAGGSSVHVEIKSPEVDEFEAEEIARGEESISRCEITGEILSGGNRFVDVKHSSECREILARRHNDALWTAIGRLWAAGDASLLESVTDHVQVGFSHGPGSRNSLRLWDDRGAGLYFDAGHTSGLEAAAYQITRVHARIARELARAAAAGALPECIQYCGRTVEVEGQECDTCKGALLALQRELDEAERTCEAHAALARGEASEVTLCRPDCPEHEAWTAAKHEALNAALAQASSEPTGAYYVEDADGDTHTVRVLVKDENGFYVAGFGNAEDACLFTSCVNVHDELVQAVADAQAALRALALDRRVSLDCLANAEAVDGRLCTLLARLRGEA